MAKTPVQFRLNVTARTPNDTPWTWFATRKQAEASARRIARTDGVRYASVCEVVGAGRPRLVFTVYYRKSDRQLVVDAR